MAQQLQLQCSMDPHMSIDVALQEERQEGQDAGLPQAAGGAIPVEGQELKLQLPLQDGALGREGDAAPDAKRHPGDLPSDASPTSSSLPK